MRARMAKRVAAIGVGVCVVGCGEPFGAGATRGDIFVAGVERHVGSPSMLELELLAVGGYDVDSI